MPVRIRLQKKGRKKVPYYHIVAADSRAPRDGKLIEKLGTYDPKTNPATIVLDNDKALEWLKNGAQPSDTCKAILSYKGVLYKYHLLKGVQKGALTEDEVEVKYQKWVSEKESKILSKKQTIAKEKAALNQSRVSAELKVNEAREKAIAEKNAKLAEKNKQKEEALEEVKTEVVEEVLEIKAEAPVEAVTESSEEVPEVKEEVQEEDKSESAEEDIKE